MPHAPLMWKTRLFAAIIILTNTLGNFCIARGMKHLSAPVRSPLGIIQAIFTPWVMLGISLLILWLLTRMALLSWADLSYVLPVTSLGYAASAMMGHFLLHEQVSPQRWMGTGLIVAGTILVGVGTHTGDEL